MLEEVYERYPRIPDIEYYDLKADVSAEELVQLNNIFPGTDLPDGYTSLTPDEYNTIYEAASAEDKIFLEGVYSRYPAIPDIVSYDLIADLSARQHTQLFLLLDDLSDDSETVLDKPVLAVDSDHVGIIALSGDEYIGIIAGNIGAEGLFNQVTSTDDEVFYLLKDVLSNEEKLVIEDIERRYIRDVIEFPYYGYNETEASYIIKDGLSDIDKDRISDIFSGLGFTVFTRLNRSLKYFSNAVLPVFYDNGNPAANVDNLVPEGSVPVEHNNPGIVRIPFFDSNGRSSSTLRYIHQFNAESDYSTENLIKFPDNIYNENTLPGTHLDPVLIVDKMPEEFERFSGGVAGW
ncbi:MAG: hypothetical protein KAR21_24655, partial [Spirochaetales bacterium]|nr:hypothetical protein [Spirochaetales bacterium]